MKPDIAEKWALELESGKWKQGIGLLNRSGYSYCCLGVLCEMAVQAGVIEAPHHGLYGKRENRLDLPMEVREWAGTRFNSPHWEGTEHLSDMNDTGATFPEIAALIREHAEEL